MRVKDLNSIRIEGICEAVEEDRMEERTKGRAYLVRVDGLV